MPARVYHTMPILSFWTMAYGAVTLFVGMYTSMLPELNHAIKKRSIEKIEMMGTSLTTATIRPTVASTTVAVYSSMWI